ncbi:hypothetical protein A3195_16540 [Candidatus Thiodiazotropha endoloripes]|uniref:hypothetical protein n=1 Tax=Candidatus Thiodiazotropha endoloripes TaxID=1818881 RepID=UPI00083CBAF0|nr:hypothetical protein [Candidatus Thiodiazotropha endoloripes]ODB87137.1 hypothetical protein A3195_16540 [Candidatus Thiodiazotropha endoloripes]
MTRVFRGVTTTPEKLIKRHGFKAWQSLDRNAALNVIASYCLKGTYNPPNVNNALVSNMLKRQIDLALIRRPTEGEQDYQRRREAFCPNLNDLRVLVKKEKRNDTFWISTDPTPACGGYAGNYVYWIELPELRVVSPGFKHKGISIGNRQGRFAKLLTDGSGQVVALDLYGNAGAEYAFLTGIKLDWIKYVKHKQRSAIPESYELVTGLEFEGPWYKMPTGWQHNKVQPKPPTARTKPPRPDKRNRPRITK